MVVLLLFGISLVDWAADSFNVYYKYLSTCAVEEAIDPYSCVIVSFVALFKLSDALVIYVVIEMLFLVGGSDTTYDNNPLWFSETLPVVPKKSFLPYMLMNYLVDSDILEKSLNCF